MLQLNAGRKSRATQAGGRSCGERDSTFSLGNQDGWTSGYELLCRFEELGHLDDLQQAISLLEASIRSTSVWDYQVP
ncbi:hypothetical protein J3R83DRAFT_1508 [Lanmaoa asiatica]|nr:hypothetical protein J3R83DRAFT_1508 [Lanmaoa asiatica]